MSPLPPPGTPPRPAPRPPGAEPPAGYVSVGWNGVPRPPRVDGLAIAALLCAPAGLLCFLSPVVGVILGLVARSRIRSSRGELTGAGVALAAVIVCSLMVATVAAFFVASRLLRNA